MESLKKTKERVKIIFETLDPIYTREKTALKYIDPFQLLVATILSAQCTDERVNQVTKTLFKKYKSPKDYINAPIAQLEDDIRPTGFFKNKTKSIKGCAQGILDLYGGKVPSTMEEMIKLPGVGRKTANVVLGAAFGVPGVVGQPALSRGHLAHALGRVERAEGRFSEAAVQVGSRAPVALVGGDLDPRGRPGVSLLRDPAAGERHPHHAAALIVAPDEKPFAVPVVVEAAQVDALRVVVQVEPLHVHEGRVGGRQLLAGVEAAHPEPGAKSVRPREPVVLRVLQLDACQADANGIDSGRARPVADGEAKAGAGIGGPKLHLAADLDAIGPLPQHEGPADAVGDLA